MWIDPKQDPNKTQNPDSLNSPSVGAGAGGGAPQVQSSTTAATGTPSSTNPTPEAPNQKFGTIQDYFKGNKNQGEQLGEQFTNKLADTQQTQKNTIDQAAAQTKNDINAGTTAFDQGLVSNAVADPTKITGDADLFNKFTNQWNAAYKGPESFEASNQYGEAVDTANKAKEKQAQVESTGGRQQLLQDEFGVYGQGNKGLDEALLQQSSYFPKVQEQAKQFGTVQDYLGQKAQDVNTAAQQARDTTATTKENTQNAFANSLTDFQKNLTGKVTAAQGQGTDLLKKYQSDLANSPGEAAKDLAASGVDPATAKNIVEYLKAYNTQYGISPTVSSAYIGNPSVDIKAGNVATTADYNKAAALQQLTGKDYSGILNPADISKAGTGTLPQNAFKSNDLQGYLKTGLDIQDKSFLNRPVNIGNDLRNMADPKLATAYVQKYIDATKRQGIDPKTSPILKELLTQAMNAEGHYLGIGRKDVAAGMSAISAPLVGLGVHPK